MDELKKVTKIFDDVMIWRRNGRRRKTLGQLSDSLPVFTEGPTCKPCRSGSYDHFSCWMSHLNELRHRQVSIPRDKRK